jgi:hypothetical protein
VIEAACSNGDAGSYGNGGVSGDGGSGGNAGGCDIEDALGGNGSLTLVLQNHPLRP